MRTPQDFDKLCLGLLTVWNGVLFRDSDPRAAAQPGPMRLNGIFVLRSIDASWEEGGLLPHVGRS